MDPQSPSRLEVGRIGRPHGVRGDVYVDLVTDRVERVAPGSRLYAGEWLTVERSRAVQRRWVVHFEGVQDRTAAEALVGRLVEAEPIEDDDTLWVHRLIGARVLDISADPDHPVDRGRCVSVVANPAHELLELESGALVPVTFVVDHDLDTIRVVVPEGLFDL